uniref:Uncharacterized protein n=1 Tax=Arundo donax TaxID=35708 RepID=A0A0A8Z1V7_ARUDO
MPFLLPGLAKKGKPTTTTRLQHIDLILELDR